MTPGHLLIRADASAKIGTGHVMRCLALAQAWQDAGGKASFLMADSTPALDAKLPGENCEIVRLSVVPGSQEDAVLTDEYACRCRADWLVTDGYSFDASFQECVQRSDRKLMCIDDIGECNRYVADIVLNQNLTASEYVYRHCLPSTQLLLGPSFCLLRREFKPWRKWRREISVRGHTVLVTLGGSTPADVGVRVMESLGRAKIQDVRVIFVVGGSSPDVPALENCAVRFGQQISIRRDVSNMADLMAQADIAISAAGSTCWELCLLGLPSILLDVADNQVAIALELSNRGCALYAGSGIRVAPDELASSVESLLASQQKRQSISLRARQLVDGLGAERVISAMCDAANHPIGAASGVRA
jgi:UDP-2,4-diacetamido-2,4,6-trideoxy-beta-L-altropyranose hydrolase